MCVISTDGSDYYGTFNNVVEIKYFGSEGSYRTILFKCDWIDNSPKGLVVHDLYKLVDVNPKLIMKGHNPFVLAHQVDQVFYAPYPSTKKDNPWMAVFKIKARSQIDAPIDELLYQEEVMTTPLVSAIYLTHTADEDTYEVLVEGHEEEVDEDEGWINDDEEELMEEQDDIVEEDDLDSLFNSSSSEQLEDSDFDSDD